MKKMTYPHIRPTLKTGDVILFSGRSAISTAIKIAARSQWSHVGQVIKSDVITHTILLSWESTTLVHIPDVESGTVKSGVMLLPLSYRIATYNGRIAIRSIREPLTIGDKMILMDMRHETRNTPYEKDMIELAKSEYDGPFGMNKADLSSIFCVELIAAFGQRIGRISEDQPANEYELGDFAKRLNDVYDELIMITP